jgi:hypothetical protein
VRGTVKAQKEYNGAPDTTLTRCKIKVQEKEEATK